MCGCGRGTGASRIQPCDDGGTGGFRGGAAGCRTVQSGLFDVSGAGP